MAWEAIEAKLREKAAGDVKWREGKTGLYIFNAGPEVEQVKKAAYAMFSEENGLGPAAFPSLAQMEREIVGFGLSLLNAPEGAAGGMTSGGTDSIVMAVKAARDYARANGKSGPLNIVTPFSAHPAFHKAAMMMDLEVRRTPLKDYLADPVAIGDASDHRTIMIVGSAPCFPFGLIDPIAELGELAERRKLWLHVGRLRRGIPRPLRAHEWRRSSDVRFFRARRLVDLRRSAQIRLRLEGASTVFFRTEAMKEHMIFDAGPWPLGRMITPTLAGTRPGGAIAAAWAVMHFLGVEGYREKQRMVTQAREKIEAGVTRLGFRVLGRPQLGIVSFAHDEADVFALLGKLHHKGWITAANIDPKALHLMLSPVHLKAADTYLNDLEEALREGAGKAAQAPRYAG